MGYALWCPHYGVCTVVYALWGMHYGVCTMVLNLSTIMSHSEPAAIVVSSQASSRARAEAG